jgi:hypothetical protein
VGIVADFFVAPPAFALERNARIRNDEAILSDGFERAQYKNFLPMALGMLWAILRHEKWDARRHDLEHVCHTENGERWLVRFPDELTYLISILDETTIDAVASDWVNREVPGNSEELKPVLQDLKKLAAGARKDGRALFLWGTL